MENLLNNSFFIWTSFWIMLAYIFVDLFCFKIPRWTKRHQANLGNSPHSNKYKENLKYENDVMNFIAQTPDFSDFSERIAQWFEKHPDQFDIRKAYKIIKFSDNIKK